jgi:hypothetical protein
MAPESYRDEKCTEKIDIYSLAMMIWEMLVCFGFTRVRARAGLLLLCFGFTLVSVSVCLSVPVCVCVCLSVCLMSDV